VVGIVAVMGVGATWYARRRHSQLLDDEREQSP
jgi:hypothetical protein